MNLQSFLHPKRKKNLRFVLSDAFVGEDGGLVEWEMRELSNAESLMVQNQCEGRGSEELSLALVAEALVVPDLRDAALLQGLSDREGRTILNPAEALRVLVTGAEFARLCTLYTEQNCAQGFDGLVEQAKN